MGDGGVIIPEELTGDTTPFRSEVAFSFREVGVDFPSTVADGDWLGGVMIRGESVVPLGFSDFTGRDFLEAEGTLSSPDSTSDMGTVRALGGTAGPALVNVGDG